MWRDAESRGLDQGASRSSIVEGQAKAETRRAVLWDALQHPATMLPLALGGLSGIYLGLISEQAGGATVAIIFIVGSTLTGAGHFFWRYSKRFQEEYPKKIREALAILAQTESELEAVELRDLRESLRTSFTNINAEEGLDTLNQVGDRYDRLQPVLEAKRATDPIAMAQIPALAEETYRQGLRALEDALRLMTAIHSPNNERMESEVAELEKELEDLRSDASQAARVRMREETIASHRELLELVSQQQLRVDQLLHQTEGCAASLDRTRIEIAALKADSAESRVSAVTDALRRTINQAKEVQEELRRLGY